MCKAKGGLKPPKPKLGPQYSVQLRYHVWLCVMHGQREPATAPAGHGAAAGRVRCGRTRKVVIYA